MTNKPINTHGFIPIIGLEVHIELKTKSKMFCGCRNDPFGAKQPNIYTCPVCLGLPGALPVPNKKAIEWTIKLGLALGCQINPESRFDRKHYFYPDLPKGYQISQYQQPFAVKGSLKSETRIRRVHLEEDTGKLLHRTLKGKKVTLIDFNRSGVPLLEVVTEPDIRSAAKTKEVGKKIQQIVRFLGISNADMEKGSMRLEANVSLLKTNGQIDQIDESQLPNYKVELKNINSFRFMERAIEDEIKRQKRLFSRGEEVKQQTRGWDAKTRTTKPQRGKETEADYRYFPEPDIPPIRLASQQITNIRSQIPKLPDDVYEELINAGVRHQDAKIISTNQKLARVVSAVVEQPADILENFAKWILHHQKEAQKKDPHDLLDHFKREGISIISDENRLKNWASQAIKENSQAVADFRKGKQTAISFLIGQVQKQAAGKANVPKVKQILLELLR